MTDEEKAEEYADDKYCKFCKDLRFCNNKCSKWDDTYTDYLDGLTEGRKEKWHDLRKDPNDLPQRNIYVLCVNRKHRYEVGCIGYDHNCEIYWHDISHNIVEPIAWCELPQYKEM